MKKVAFFAIAAILAGKQGWAETTFNIDDANKISVGGVIDLYTEFDNSVRKSVVMNPGGLTQNVFGLSFQHLMNPDMSVGANLQIGYAPDSGKGASGAMGTSNVVFGKRATIDLVSQKYGSLAVGRQGTLFFSGLTKYDGLSWGSGIGPFLYNGPNITTVSNAISYKTPEIAGAQLSVQYSLGEVTGSNSDSRAGSSWMSMLEYNNGGLHAHAGYWATPVFNCTSCTGTANLGSSLGNSGVNIVGNISTSTMGVSYQFDRFKPWAMVVWTHDTTPDGTAATYGFGSGAWSSNNALSANQRAFEVGLKTQINREISMYTIYGGMTDYSRSGLGGNMASLRFNYDYDSKLTFWSGLAVLHNQANSYFQDYGASPTTQLTSSASFLGGSNYTTSATYAGKSINAIATGIRYRF